MKKLYEGTRNKLDYVSIKLRNAVDDFYLNDIKTRFTQNIEQVIKLEAELDQVEYIANCQYVKEMFLPLVAKYCSIADEFRLRKSMR